MLVIANGAPKSGSTWLYNILSEMKVYSIPPQEFLLDKNNVNPEIKYDKLEAFLGEIEGSDSDYLLKNHFSSIRDRDLILSHSNIAVFDIARSLKDVVVSHYHYLKHRNPDYNLSFTCFYWTDGRYVADQVRNFHKVWSETGDKRVFVASYENLKADFQSEIQSISNHLGIKLSDKDIERIKQNTDMTKLREKYGDHGENKFFRKGVVGDWVNYFSGLRLGDINAIERRGIEDLGFFRKNLGRLLLRWYKFLI